MKRKYFDLIRCLAIYLPLFFGGGLLQGAVYNLNESSIQIHKQKLNALDSVEAVKQAALWLQGEFNPEQWIAISDLAFIQKNQSLATQLSKDLPSVAPLHLSYLMKGIYQAVIGDSEQASLNFDSTTRASDRLVVSRGFYYQGELIYQSLKTPQKASRDLERMHYFFKKALEFNPEHAPSYFGIARRYIHQEKWELATKQLELTLKADADDVLARYNLGIILAQKKDWDNAFTHLMHAHVLKPDDNDIAKELVMTAFYGGRESIAQGILGNLIKDKRLKQDEIFPIVKIVLFKKIEQTYRVGQFKKALEQYQELEKRFPEIAEIKVRIGICYRDLSDFRSAGRYLKSYIEKKPQDPIGYFEMGVLTYKQNHKNMAARQFLKALALSPRDRGNIWLWVYKTLKELNLQKEALFVLGKADAHPFLDIEYRDIVTIQKQKMEKALKFSSQSIQGITFSSIENLLRQSATRNYHSEDLPEVIDVALP
jgi:tetratricopeptide (TPR) repeat protein